VKQRLHLLCGAVALLAAALPAAQAQSSTDAPAASGTGPSTPIVVAQAGPGDTGRRGWGMGSGQSLLPGTARGYFGLNVGRPSYDVSCGLGGFECDDPDVGFHVYTGGMFTEALGLEFGYLNLGRADRLGGRTRAQGLNFSLMARLPLAPFSVYGKLGTTYGRTRVSGSPLAGQPLGRETGWGAAYGAGVGFDLSPRTALVLEWMRHEMRFAGTGRDNVDLKSLGLVMRF
jgi:OOP family OmpA-OmpF porin